jgi:hypothetical protein
VVTQLLPVIPAVDDELLGAYHQAHGQLDAELTASTVEVAMAWHHCMVELHKECLARIEPVLKGAAGPLLFPRPRAFLSAKQRARRAGVTAAWRYIDTRLAMQRQGFVPHALVPETPYVLHALSEGRIDNPLHTNPGMARVTDNWWVNKNTDFKTAPTDLTRAIVDTAVDTALASDAPGAVVGGWLSVVFSSAHPFVDGNGRMLRLLFLLMSGRDLPRTMDWGIAEQMLVYRDRYVDPLERGHMQDGADYDGALMDAEPFIRGVIQWSTEGAQLARQRLQVVTALYDAVRAWGVESEDTTVILAAVWRGLVGPAELAREDGPDYRALVESFQRVVAGGAMTRAIWPPSRRDDVRGPAYRLSDEAERVTTALVRDLAGSAQG